MMRWIFGFFVIVGLVALGEDTAQIKKEQQQMRATLDSLNTSLDSLEATLAAIHWTKEGR